MSNKTISALLVSGLSTVVNLTTLLALRGEHGLECLLCCSIDVTANSLALAWCTAKIGEEASLTAELAEAPSIPSSQSEEVIIDKEEI